MIGRRPEIYKAIKEGRYREWLLESQTDDSVRPDFQRFRQRFRGNRKAMEQAIQEELDAIEAGADSSFLISRTVYSKWIPEQRLWGSVLLRAIYDFVTCYKYPTEKLKNDSATMAMGKEVCDWFDGVEGAGEIGSFSWICYILDLGDWEVLRDKVHTLTREHLPRQCKSRKKK